MSDAGLTSPPPDDLPPAAPSAGGCRAARVPKRPPPRPTRPCPTRACPTRCTPGPPSAAFAYVRCPECAKVVRLDRPKLRPGRFRLTCGACRGSFALVVDAKLDARGERLPKTPPRRPSVLSDDAADDDSLPPELAGALGLGPPPPRPAPPRAPPRAPPPAPAGPHDKDATPVPGATLSLQSATPALPNGTPASGADATLPPPDPASSPTAGLASTLDLTRATLSDLDDATAASAAADERAADDAPGAAAGERLGGYELKSKLGEGGMGAVFRARQLSLDRDVALKILAPRLARSASFVGRFMREAYAAGQLVHHNVVQIHDFGHDGPVRPGQNKPAAPVHYFSMELVDGQSLQKLVEARGRLEPKEAVGLVLQAARGLAFAHAHKLIHRDVKPDNLLLNKLGVVKVADLGLVKPVGVDEPADEVVDGVVAPVGPGGGTLSAAAASRYTHAGALMGTPAYLSPEQAADAKTADARTDVYSLGCTLYHLLFGRPPFGGRTLKDVLDAHRFKKLEFPGDDDPAAPKIGSTLKDVLRRMCGKSPDDRYRTMDDAADALDLYLRKKHEVTGEPDAKQIGALRWAAEQFEQSAWAKARPLILAGAVIALIVAAFVVLTTVDDPLLGFGLLGGLLGVGVLGSLSGLLFAGAARRDALFVRTRQVATGLSLRDAVLGLVAAALLIAVLYSFGWLWWWFGAAVLALGIGWAWANVVDKGVRGDREPMVRRAEMALREMRGEGVSEARLRKAAIDAAAPRWEGFYEALFGYEAAQEARRTLGEGRGGGWRDGVIGWLDARLEHRKLDRDDKLLRGVAKGELVAAGVPEAAAERQAMNQARRELAKAHLLRDQIRQELRRELRRAATDESKPEPADPTADTPEKEKEGDGGWDGRRDGTGKIRPKATKYTDDDFERIHESYFKRRYGSPIDLLLGQQARFALAAVLLACFALWFNQNQKQILLGSDEAVRQATDADAVAKQRASGNTGRRQADLDAAAAGKGRVGSAKSAPAAAQTPTLAWWERFGPDGGLDDLDVPGVGPSPWLSGLHVGLAGLLLGAGAFFYGRALAVAQFLAAAVVLVGTPLLAESPPWLWVPGAAGAALWAASTFLLRQTQD